MLYMTSEADIIEDICRRRYQPRTNKELNYRIDRVFDANQKSPTFSSIALNSTSILSPNHFVWLPEQDLDHFDYSTVLAHQDACNTVNNNSAWSRLQLHNLLNSPIDMDQVLALAYVHQGVKLQQTSNQEQAFGFAALDQGTEYFKKHTEKLMDAMEEFNQLLKQIMSDHYKNHRVKLSPGEKKALKEVYEKMNREYVNALRYTMTFLRRKNLLIHRDPWRRGGINNLSNLWETSQDALQTLTHVLSSARAISYSGLILELWTSTDEVYKTYKNHGDWKKELAKEIGEIVGGAAGSFLFFLVAPETVVFIATVLVGGLLSVALSDLIGIIFEDIYEEYEESEKNL